MIVQQAARGRLRQSGPAARTGGLGCNVPQGPPTAPILCSAMQRLAVLLLVTTIAVAVPALARAGGITLKIVYRASDTSKPRLLELHCTSPAHGTLPAPASTCRKLAALGDDALARPDGGAT